MYFDAQASFVPYRYWGGINSPAGAECGSAGVNHQVLPSLLVEPCVTAGATAVIRVLGGVNEQAWPLPFHQSLEWGPCQQQTQGLPSNF